MVEQPDERLYGNPLKGTAVYRFFDARGELLYIGITGNFGQRWRKYVVGKAWYADVRSMMIVWYKDTATAGTVEQHAIETEKPRHNVTHNHGRQRLERHLLGQGWRPSPAPDAVKARAVYRRSLKNGYPLSAERLASKYGRSRTWGVTRICEVKGSARTS